MSWSSGTDEADKPVSKKAKISRSDLNDIMVVVKVGTKKKSFTIHKRLLCKSASYFTAALDGNFQEAQNQVLELPDEKVAMFERFQLWLYTKGLVEETESMDDVSWNTLLDLYIFGDTRGIAGLQNGVIDVCIDKSDHENTIPMTPLPRVYNRTPANCALRRLFVDWYAYDGALEEEWFTSGPQGYPQEFLIDLVVALYEIKMGTKPPEWDFRASRSSYYVVASKAQLDTSDINQERQDGQK